MNRSTGNTVDSKVVELQFQNQQFESNAKQSLSTIERLKQALNFTHSVRGLDAIDNSVKLNQGGMSALTSAVGTLHGALDNIGNVAAFSMIADEAIKAKNAVEGFIKSVTLDQVTAGWQKYADKTSAVQTIMSATAKDWEDQGAQMEYVNGQLEKLNWFTDETSYNFLDMVNNIGKFTSNQIPLDKSVTAMQGISTWAAKSGANVGEASRAMYNLSQAIGIGSVKLMDWRSIENANMATAEFKETVIQTAEAMGTLTKVEDGLWKTQKGNEVSVKNFNEYLKDEWFSSDVLIGTLDKYGGFTDKLYGYMEEVDIDTTSKLLGFVEDFKNGTIDWGEAVDEAGVPAERLKEILSDLGSEEMDFGRKAFVAAQEAKTFQEAIDAAKDAASTAWMNLFETVFGNYLDAKSLWTDFAEFLYDVFVPPVTKTTKLLQNAFKMTNKATMDDWNKFSESGMLNPAVAKRLRGVVEENGFVVDHITDDMQFLKAAVNAGAVSIDDFKSSLEGFGSSGKLVAENVDQELKQRLEEGGEDIQAYVDKIKELSKDYSADEIMSIVFGDGTYNNEDHALEETMDGLMKTLGLTQDQGDELRNVLIDMGALTDGVSKSIVEMSLSELMALGYTKEQAVEIGRLVHDGKTLDQIIERIGLDGQTGADHWLNGLNNLMEIVYAFMDVVGAEWSKVFPSLEADSIFDILKAFDEGTSGFLDWVKNSEGLKSAIEAVANVFDLLLKNLRSFAGAALLKIFVSLAGVLGKVVLGFVGMIGAIAKGAIIFEALKGFITGFTSVLAPSGSGIAKLVTRFTQWLKVADPLNKILNLVNKTAEKAGRIVAGWIDKFTKLPFVQKNVKRFGAAFKRVFADSDKILKGAGASWKVFTGRVGKILSDGFQLSDVKDIFQAFKDTIVKYFTNTDAFKAVKTAFKLLWDDLKKGVDGIGSFIWEYLSNLRVSLGDSIPGKILGFFMDMFVKVKEAVVKAWGVLGSGEFSIGSIFKAIGSLFGDFFEFLFKLGKKALKIALIVAPILIIVKIVKGVIGLFRTIPNLFGSISDAIGSIGGYFDAKAMGEKANALLKVAVALGVMVAAVYVLTKLDTAKMLVAVGVIAALGLILVGIMALINVISSTSKKAAGIKGVFEQFSDSITGYIDAKKMEAQSKSLLYIAAAVGILVASIYVLAKLDPKQLIIATAVVVALTALMTGVLFLISNMNKGQDKGATIKGALSMLAVALAVGLLVNAINSIKVDNSLGKKLAVVAVLVAAMTGVIAILTQLSKGKDKGATIKSALALLAVALSIRMLVGALNAIKVNKSLAARVLIVAALLAAMTGVIAILTQLGKGKDKGATITSALSLLAVALSIKMLVSAINSLVVDNSLVARVLVIAALLAAMTGVIILLSKFGSKSNLSGVLSIVAIAGAVWIVSDALNKLSSVDPENLAAATLALSAVILACTVLAAATGIFKPALLSSLAMVAIIGVIGLVVYNLAKLPVKRVSGVADAITKLMLGLSVAMAAAALIGSIGPAAIIGAGVMLVFFGAITAIVLAAMTYLADSGVMESLVDSLTTLADGLVPFANAISGISPGSFDGLVALAGAFSSIVIGEIMSGLYQLFAGETPITSFVKQLPELAQGLNDYAAALGDDIDTDTVNASASAIALLADICKNNIQDGGIMGWLTGNASKISQFAEQLPDLANGLKTYADAIDETTFNEDKINASAELVKLLSDLTNNYIPEGGVIGWLKGNGSKIEQWAGQLPALADALSQYADKINETDFSEEKINASTNLAQVLAALSKDQIQDGGVVGWLTGNDTKIEDWAEQLPTLAEKLKEYVSIIDEATFSEEKITASTNLASVLASISGDQIDDGGVIGWLKGSGSKIRIFAGQLPALARALASYMKTINAQDFDPTKIEASQTLAATLASLAGNDIPDGGVIGWLTGTESKIRVFAGQLPALARALASYMKTINAKDFDPGKIEASQTLAATLASLAGNDIPDGGVIGWLTGTESKIRVFAGQLPALARALASYMKTINATDFDPDKIEVSKTLASTLASLAGDEIPEGGVIGWLKGNGERISDFSGQLPELAEALAGFMGTVSAEEFNQDKVDAATGLASVLAALAGDEIPAGGIIGWLEGNDTKIKAFADQMPSLGTGISGFVANLAGDINSDKVKTATKAVSAIADIAQGLVNFEYVDDAKFDKLGDNLLRLAAWMETFANEFAVNDVESDPEAMLANIKAAKQLTDALATLDDISLKKNPLSDDDLVTRFKSNLETIADALSALNGKTFEGVDNLKEAVDKLATADYATALENMSGGSNDTAASDAGGEVVSKVAGGMNSGAVTEAMGGVMSDALGVVQGATGFRGAGESITEKIAGGISSGSSKEAMNSAISDLMSGTKSALDGYYDSFRSSGAYVSSGFTSGIYSQMLEVLAAAQAIAQAAVNRIKQVIQSNSPSKVTMRLGNYFGEGFEIGILDQVDAVSRASKAVGEAAKDGLGDAIKGINALVSSDLDTQPVIRPVLDLSEVQSGASNIASLLTAFGPIDAYGNLSAIDNAVEQRRQRASLEDVVNALGSVSENTSNIRGGDTYNVNGITYDDGSNIADAVKSIVRAARVGRRS